MSDIDAFEIPTLTNVLVKAQNIFSGAGRDQVAGIIADRVNDTIENPYSGNRWPAELSRLRSIGIVKSPIALSASKAGNVLDYFKSTECYAAHVPVYSDGKLRSVESTAAVSNYGSYSLDQCLRAPHLIEFALDEGLLDIVGAYLGCVPTLYSMNTFWTFPKARSGNTHDYHRDEDDYRFLAVFIYWTNVTKGEGEFYFVPETHRHDRVTEAIQRARKRFFARKFELRDITDFDSLRRKSRNGYGSAETYSRLFGMRAEIFDGCPRTTFIGDTFGLHRGSNPKTRPRLATWLRFGLYKNEAYHIDGTMPSSIDLLDGRVEMTERNRFICRLIAR